MRAYAFQAAQAHALMRAYACQAAQAAASAKEALGGGLSFDEYGRGPGGGGVGLADISWRWYTCGVISTALRTK